MNNFLTLQELISEAAKSLGKPMIYWSASKIRDLEAKGEVDKFQHNLCILQRTDAC